VKGGLIEVGGLVKEKENQIWLVGFWRGPHNVLLQRVEILCVAHSVQLSMGFFKVK
jgi:hypothetical protein